MKSIGTWWIRLANLPLRYKLTVYMFLSLIILVNVVGYIIHTWSARQMYKQALDWGLFQTKQLAMTAEGALITENQHLLEQIVSQLSTDPRLLYIRILNPTGTMLAESDKRGLSYYIREDDLRRLEKVQDKDETLTFRTTSRNDVPAGVIRFPVIRKGDSRRIGVFEIVLSYDWIQKSIRHFQFMAVLLTLFLSLLGAGLVYFLMRDFIRQLLHLTEIGQDIAAGRLKIHFREGQKDELGVLENAIQRMVRAIQSMISQISSLFRIAQQTASEADRETDGLGEHFNRQKEALDKIGRFIVDLNTLLDGVGTRIEQLAASSEETSSSILEMAASIEEMAGNIDTLASSVEETATAIEEMSVAIREIDSNIERLANFIFETSSSMKEMEASIRQVDQTASESYQLAGKMAQNAQQGMSSVSETIQAMSKIKESVDVAASTMNKLAGSSQEIGTILNVIEDIADQTNLLALNAAIIAAQAGEHGRGFAVVAEEIRDLAERTMASTKEIATLITNVQKDVQQAETSIQEGSRRVLDGVRLSNEAGEALRGISDFSQRSNDMAREIAKATEEQTKSIRVINHAIEQINELVRQINTATSSQKEGSAQIMRAVENMRELSEYVRRAIQEQAKGSRQITEATEKATEMVNYIFGAMEETRQHGQQIQGSMEDIARVAEDSVRFLNQVRQHFQKLLEYHKELQGTMTQFQFSPENPSTLDTVSVFDSNTGIT